MAKRAPAKTIVRPQPPRAPSWPLDDGSDSEDDEAASTAERLRVEAEERARPIPHPLPTPLSWTTTYHSDDEQDDDIARGEGEVLGEEAPSLHPIVSLDIYDRRITAKRTAGESKDSGSMLMSTSSDHKNANLLYADSHAPYLYIHRTKPLSVWVVGGPLSGCDELAAALAKRLSLVLITLESCISYARDAKQCVEMISSMDDGKPLSGADVAILLAAKLSSHDVIFAGYVLTSLSCAASDLDNFASRKELATVWPPQYIVDLNIDDKDVYSRAISLRDRVIGTIGPDAELKEALRLEEEEKKREHDNNDSNTIHGSGGNGGIGRASRQSRRPRSSGADSTGPSSHITNTRTNPNGNHDEKAKKKKKQPKHDDDDDNEGDDDEDDKDDDDDDNEHQSDDNDDRHDQHAHGHGHDDDASVPNDGTSTARSSNRRIITDDDAHHLIDHHHDDDTIIKDDGMDAGGSGWCATSMELSLAPVEMLQHELKLYHHDRPNMKRLIQSLTSAAGRTPGGGSGASAALSSPLLPADATQSPIRLVDLVMHAIGQQRHYSRAARLDIPLEFKLPTDDADQPEILMPLDLQHKDVLINETFGVWQHYCPVSLVDKQLLVEGSLEYAASYQGSAYLFGSEGDARRFMSNPDRYIHTPPSLPSPYTVALVGAHATGKTTIAQMLKERYGWHVVTKDIDGKDMSGQSIIDGAPTNKEQLEELLKRSVRIDRVIMLYVDEVELLADRRRPPDQRRAARAAAAAAATAANLAATLPSSNSNGNGSNGMIASESKGDIRVDLTHRNIGDGKTDHSQEEEDLMDAAYEYQEKLWPVFAQILDERHIKYSEIDASLTIEQVIDGVRAAMDPFYQYRRRNGASVLTKEQIDRSARDEDRFDMRPSARLLRYDRTVFCPVCLVDRRLLVPGRDTLNVRVVNNSYSCCSNDCVTKFVSHHDMYHIHNQSRVSDLGPDMPDVKILIVGGRATGKTNVSQMIRHQFPRITRVATVSSLLHAPLLALTQRVLKQCGEAEAKRIADRSARDAARRDDEEKRERERKERRDRHDTDDDEHSTRAPSAASATSVAGRDDDDDDDGDDRDKDILINFAKADPTTPQPYEISLRDLMESNWLRDNDIDDIWRTILSHGHELYPSPAGYIIEVDIHNHTLLDRLANVIATHNESKPHMVVPVEASSSVCITRLLSGDKAVRSKLIRDSKSRPTSATSQDSTMGESEERGIWTDFHTTSLRAVESLLTAIRSATIVVCEPIDGELTAKRAQKQVMSSINPFVMAQRAVFQPVESISRHDAVTLIHRGMKALRSYGSMCPVCLANGVTYDCTLHDDRQCSPVIWSQWVIYLCNDTHRSLFATHVVKYIAQTPPRPSISSSCIVLGHILSGKTALALRLSEELGLVYLELTQLVRTLAESNTQLGRDVQAILHSGGVMTDAMKVRIIHHAVNTSMCRIHGWVLDDFPETVSQAQLLRQYGIIPHHVFGISSAPISIALPSVHARVSGVVANAQAEYEQIVLAGDRPGSNGEALSIYGNNGSGGMWLAGYGHNGHIRDINDDITLYHQRCDAIYGHYTRLYDNVRMLSHERSPWHISDAALSIMRENRTSRQAHRALTLADRPGAIVHMNIPRGRRRASRSIYKDYCPVAWIVDGALRRSSVTQPFTVLEFRGKYYWISSVAYVDMFNNDPIRFAGPAALAKGLPAFLPYHVSMDEAKRIESRNCELLGHCSVSLKQAIDHGEVKEVFMGVTECTVSYKNRLYRFANQQQMNIFMQWPEVYWQIQLPVPLPKPIVDIPPLELLKMGNSLGFMEKSVSTIINKALVSMDKLRLKYPGMPIGRSSLLYLALYLKAHKSSNESHVTAKYAAKLKQFQHHCQLIPLLSQLHSGSRLADATQEIKSDLGSGSGVASTSSSSSSSSSSYGSVSDEYDHIRRLIDKSAVNPKATLDHLRSYFR